MRFTVLCLRYRGRVIPRRELAQRTPFVGDLRIEYLRDEELGRYVRFARLVSELRVIGPGDLPELIDPVLVGMSPQAFTLTGFERVDGAAFAQSWYMTIP